MPLPAGVIAALGTAGSITGVLGSAADYASLAFTVADHLKAQEGLKYNSHVFVLDQSAPPTPASSTAPAERPASATSRGQRGGRTAAAARPQGQEPHYNVVTGGTHALLSIQGSDARAFFALQPYLLNSANPNDGVGPTLHVVHLYSVRGFATEMGDQAEMEFSGEAVEGGYLLSVKGIVNEFLTGFFHFWCDFLIRPQTERTPRVTALAGRIVGRGGSLLMKGSSFEINF